MTTTNISNPITLLDNFLTEYRCIDKNTTPTHTRMRGGKWNIPDDKLENFYQLYTDVLESLDTTEMDKVERLKYERFLSFTERPEPLSPIKIDLDFRYLATSPERRYTSEMIEEFAKRLLTIVNPWYLLSGEENYCFITEKPCPTIDDRKKIEGDEGLKLIKDGIHLMFPFLIIPNELQLAFREDLLKNISDVFEEMDLKTSDGKPQSMSEVIDRAVIDRNNWMMYGSRKSGCPSYDVTRIIDINVDDDSVTEVDVSDYSRDQLVRLLSMRSNYIDKYQEGGNLPESRLPGQLRQEKQAELDKNLKQYKITAGKSFAPKGKNKKCKPKVLKPDELKIVKLLVDALSTTRADNYKQWLEVGWACHNIDERLLEDWIKFSKKSLQYSGEAETACVKFWDEMNDEGLGEGSLRYWVKEDNVAKYNEILKEEAHDAIMESIEKSIETGEQKLDNALREMKIQPYDVAKVLHAMCHHEFKCVSERGGSKYGMYYHYKNHRWQESAGGILLREIVSTVIPKTYLSMITEIVSKAKDGNAECKEVLDNWKEEKESLKRFTGMFNNISTTNFKNNVMTEAVELFYDKESKAKDRFLNKLDDRNCTHLLGFENGVYDLVKGEFRPGRPEDYISISTEIEYREYTWDDEDVNAVMDFVTQVLPDEDERDYVLILLASFLNGNNRNEKFHIWTGSGGNGKSKLIELYQMAIGDYGCNLPISLLTNKRKASGEASPEMAKIKGRRFAVLQEPDVHTRINVGLMKEMTGGDTITARALYKEPIEFKPQVKMILTCNHLPELPYDDEATWRRVRSVEFKSKFVDADEVDPTDKYSHPKDEELSEKFQDWAEPFMWIILQYYKNWQNVGLKEPASVIAFTKQYQAQNDQFREFFEEYIIKDANATEPMTMAEVWQKYGEWHTINEAGSKRPKKDLQKYLEKRLGQHHMAGEAKAQGWVGYSLKQCEVYDNTSITSSWNDLDQTNV